MEKKDKKVNARPVGWQINCVRKQSNRQTSDIFPCIIITVYHNHINCKLHKDITWVKIAYISPDTLK